MAIFGDFFASCICSEPRAARFRPAFYIRTRATPCVEVWQTSDLRPLRLGEGKKEEDRRKEGKTLQGKNIMAPLLHRTAITRMLANKSSQLTDGLADDTQIAETFAEHFRKTCTTVNEGQSNRLHSMFRTRRQDHVGSPFLDE